jgi:hypothetical protein
MSIAITGATGSAFYKIGGSSAANTDLMTYAFWFKRTANFTGLKFIQALRPNTGAGHDLIINDPNNTPEYRLVIQANWAATQAKDPDVFPLNVWTYVAVVGSGANISLKVWDGSEITTTTVAQTAFIPLQEWWGDSGAGTQNVTGIFAYIRAWNAALTDAELNQEKASATRVRTLNLALDMPAQGGTIAAALVPTTGGAFTNASAATYSVDAPTFDTFAGTVISGTVEMPTEAVEIQGARVNRVLQSGTVGTSPWDLEGSVLATGAVAASTGYGTAQRITQATTGGVNQLVLSVPNGQHTLSGVFRRVNTDFVAFRLMNSVWNSGSQGIFNLVTGAWATQNNFGTHTGGLFGSRALGNGWHRIWITQAINDNAGWRIQFYPVADSAVQTPAGGQQIDVAAFQLESGTLATMYKPTTNAVVTRVLSSVNVVLQNASLTPGQTSAVTAELLDNGGAGWDQFGPLSIVSSDTSKVTISGASTTSDISGRANATANAVATGTATITASAGGFTSSGVVLTVATAGGGGTSTFAVEILVEQGWEGTSNWNVAVYEKHSTQRFPTTKLFEASGQTFQNAVFSNQSRLLVPVPGSVTVTAGQIVEVALENDNIAGSAVDGPGIFPATVIAITA